MYLGERSLQFTIEEGKSCGMDEILREVLKRYQNPEILVWVATTEV